jgi:hypothetical protein
MKKNNTQFSEPFSRVDRVIEALIILGCILPFLLIHIHRNDFNIPYRHEGKTISLYFAEATMHVLIQILCGLSCRFPRLTKIYNQFFVVKDIKLRYRYSRLIGNITRLIIAIYCSVSTWIKLSFIDYVGYMLTLYLAFGLSLIGVALFTIYMREKINSKS